MLHPRRRLGVGLVALVTALHGACGDLEAQVRWVRLPGGMPSPRHGPAISYDSVRDRLVLFGGNQGGQLLVDTWEWDGVAWAQAAAANAPSAREFHVMAYDQARRRTLLFGGQDYVPWANLLADTWEWDGASWGQVATNGPAPRWAPGMAYHTGRQRVMLFGGAYLLGPAPHSFNDLWEWDGSSWRVVAPGGGNVDPPVLHWPVGTISYGNLAYDERRNKLVVYGAHWLAQNVGGHLPVTWEWDAVAGWRQPGVSGPTLMGRNLQYDGYRARMVVFGSMYASTAWPLPFEWDGFSPSWTQRLTTTPPGMANTGPVVYDSNRGRFLYLDHNGVLWEYATGAPAAYVPIGPGCTGSLGTPSLTAAPYSLPWIADTLHVQVDGVPSGMPAALAMSLAALPTPLDLTAHGMPGCQLHVWPDLLLFRPSQGHIATWSLPIPNQPALQGLLFSQQAAVLDPAANPLGVSLSTGTTGILGMR